MSKITKKHALKGIVITIPFATLVSIGGVVIKEYTSMKNQITKLETRLDHMEKEFDPTKVTELDGRITNIEELKPKYDGAINRIHEMALEGVRTEMRMGVKIHNLENTISNLYNRERPVV